MNRYWLVNGTETVNQPQINKKIHLYNILYWLTTHNWQKMKKKSIFLACHSLETHRVEAVDLSIFIYTFKDTNLWKCGIGVNSRNIDMSRTANSQNAFVHKWHA